MKQGRVFLRYYYRMVTFYNITLSTAFSLLMLSVAEAARPNVVLINADDLGWAEVGCYGQKKIKTPNIDKLASEGQRWVYFYSGAPVCSPSRYVLMNLGEDARNELPALSKLEIADKWVLSKLNTLIAEVTENLEKYELGVAVQKVYDFIWDTYCDWYIELTKARLYSEDFERKQTAIQVLVYVLDQILRLLHPFMPFITEEIWQSIPHEGDALIAAKWPEYREDLAFKAEESHMESVMDAIRAIRNRRAEMNVPPSRKAALYVLTSKPQVYAEGEGFIQRLAYADTVTMLDKEPENLDGMVTIPTADAKLYIPMGQLVDVAKELDRISKELEKNRKFLSSLEAKLSNEKFASRAPEAVVNAEKEKAQKTRDLIASLEQSEAALKSL